MECFIKQKHTRSCCVLLLLADVPCVYFVLMTTQENIVGSVLHFRKESMHINPFNASQTTKPPQQNNEGSSTKKCEIKNNFNENLKKLESLKIKGADPWYFKLGFDNPARVLNNSSALPGIVTGANKKYFKMSQVFFKSFHEVLLPKYPDLKLIFYDLG